MGVQVTRIGRFPIEKHEELFREYMLHLRLETDDVVDLRYDALMKISEAFDIAESYTNRIIVPSIMEISMSELSSETLLPVTPCSEIISVEYLNSEGQKKSMSPEDYSLVFDDWKIELYLFDVPLISKSVRPETVWIRLKAGYGITGLPEEWQRKITIPGTIKSAVKLIAGNLFSSDGDQTVGRWAGKLNMGHEKLLSHYRISPYNTSVY